MGLDLYSTALMWSGRQGAAKLHGRQIPLFEAPALLGTRVKMIDYRPEIGKGRIHRVGGRASDMTAPEIADADEYLRQALGQRASVDLA